MSLLSAAAALLPALRPGAAARQALPAAAGGASGAGARRAPAPAPAAAPPPQPAPLPPLTFASPRLLAAYTRLAEELRLLEAVLYKSHNQHRRAPYFAAFRRLHALARRVARACEAVGRGGGQDRAAAAGAAAGRAAAAALPLCQRVLRPHTGAGFAGLGVVLAASAAVYYQCIVEVEGLLRPS